MTRRARRVALDERTCVALYAAQVYWRFTECSRGPQLPVCNGCAEYMRDQVAGVLAIYDDARRRGGEEEKTR